MQKFIPGKDYIKYNQPFFDKKEIKAVLNVLRKQWLVPGVVTEQFEKKICALFGKKYGLFVNSGSSANLLTFKCLALKKGSEVITPACTFSTTLNPIIENGLVPVFVDSKIGTYQIDIDQIKRAITKKTVALMIPHLIGNLNDMEELAKIAKRHKLILIEDSCDTMGGNINKKPTGTWSDISTTSFYASHIITAGGAGGMFMTNDKKIFSRAEMMRSWGRSIPFYWEDIDKRFKTRLEGIDYDGKFIFSEIGYNFIPTEMQAAFGLAQLQKLKKYFSTRQKNFKQLFDFFSNYKHFFYLPEENPGVNTAWLAFPLTIKESSPFVRKKIVTFLEANKIQTRPLFSGNILYHPAYKNIEHRVYGSLKNANRIMKNSFLIGIHQGITPSMIKYMITTFETFLKKYK